MPTIDFSRPSGDVAVLAVSPYAEDRQALEKVFARSRWTIYTARSCAEAADFLRSATVPVVICESDLPDGDWKDVLERIALNIPPPQLIVTTQLADDRLWAEVLNRGGYDVLAKPFCAPEVFRIVSLAWRHWKEEWQRVIARPAASFAAAR